MEEYTWHPVEERILIKDVYHNGTKNYTIYYISNEYLVIENSSGNYTEEYIYQDGALVGQVDTDNGGFPRLQYPGCAGPFSIGRFISKLCLLAYW